MNNKFDEIIYSINVEDLQTVAIQEIDRELTIEEIGKINDNIGEKIQWYDIISNVISEKISE